MGIGIFKSIFKLNLTYIWHQIWKIRELWFILISRKFEDHQKFTKTNGKNNSVLDNEKTKKKH